MIGSNKTPINLTTPNEINSSDAIKNGKSDGNTTSHHKFNPRILASSAGSGNLINDTVINTVILESNMVFKN